MSNMQMKYEEFLDNNEKLLDEFEQALKKEGISQRTINRHLSAAETYINHFLPNDGELDLESGLRNIDTYLCYWGIKKVFTSPSNITTEANGIKKFYQFLLSQGKISKEDYQEFESLLKKSLPKSKAAFNDFLNDDFDPYGEKDLF